MRGRAVSSSRSGARTVTTVVIGAGHAGLAMSRCLSERAIDHVVLERGAVANAWRHDRWDSLKLLTPNWQTRLPGFGYVGPDSDGYMDTAELVEFIEEYADAISAPVETSTCVYSVRAVDRGYRVETNRGIWFCDTLVLANGGFDIPTVPGLADALPPAIASVTSKQYRNPAQLEEGGVLVVGASATGLQLADEIHRSGRPVTLATGGHVRMPRVYRGLDIQWWMDAAGILDERYDEVDDLARARRVPSPQLVGSPDRTTLDLNALTDRGVSLVGRVMGLRDTTLQFSGSLRNVCQMADLKMNRLLSGIDDWAEQSGRSAEVEASQRFEPTRLREVPRLNLELASGEIKTIVWATGYRPDYSWLDLPVFDRKGRLKHDGGIVDAPGVYVLGLPFLRRRKSSFIHGAGEDARDLAIDLSAYLDRQARERIGWIGPATNPTCEELSALR